MKQYEISDIPAISQENFANLFNVYMINNEDYTDTLTYSTNKSVYFKNIENMAPSNFTYYTCKDKDQWSTISYAFYDTIELWWLICKVNRIKDPVDQSPIPGDVIKMLNRELAHSVAQQIRVE